METQTCRDRMLPLPTWAEGIKYARVALGLSRAQLAKRLGVSAGAVGYWERGTSMPRGADNSPTIVRIAAALQVPEIYVVVLRCGPMLAEDAAKYDARCQGEDGAI